MTLAGTSKGRAAAVLLLTVLLGGVAAAIAVPAVLLHRHYDQAIEEATDRYQRFRRVASQQAQWRQALDAFKARDVRRFLLKNQAVNLAGAELQDLVKAAIEANGGRIITVQAAQARDDGRYKAIGLNVQMFVSAANLQRILHSLETGLPYLVIENMAIRATAFRGYRPNPGVEPDVSVQFDIVGYILAAGEKG